MYAQQCVCDGFVVPGLEFERKSPGPVTVNSKTILTLICLLFNHRRRRQLRVVLYVYIGVHNRIYMYS